MTRSVLLWIVSLVLVAVASAWVSAQIVTQKVDTPILLTGPDVGFSVEGRQGSRAIGRLVVRIDGRWVEAGFDSGNRRLSQ